MSEPVTTGKAKREWRWWDRTKSPGPLRLMARAEGYAMVRRPGCAPFLLREKEWAALPPMPEGVDADV